MFSKFLTTILGDQDAEENNLLLNESKIEELTIFIKWIKDNFVCTSYAEIIINFANKHGIIISDTFFKLRSPSNTIDLYINFNGLLVTSPLILVKGKSPFGDILKKGINQPIQKYENINSLSKKWSIKSLFTSENNKIPFCIDFDSLVVKETNGILIDFIQSNFKLNKGLESFLELLHKSNNRVVSHWSEVKDNTVYFFFLRDSFGFNKTQFVIHLNLLINKKTVMEMG